MPYHEYIRPVSKLLFVFCAFLTGFAAASDPRPPDPPAAKPAPSDSTVPAPAETSEQTKRVELNLLGKEDASRGESRRNENIQFNLVDNNALKELNIRLGSTATLLNEFRPERSYFGAEFGNAPAAVLHLETASRPVWHGNVFWNHQNSIFSARSFFQVGDVKPARENRYGFSSGFHPWKGAYFSIRAGQEKLRGFVNGNVLVPRADERRSLAADPARRALVDRFFAAYPAEPPNRTDINPRALNTNAPQRIDSDDAGLRLEQSAGPADRLISEYRFIGQTVEAFQLVAGQNPNTDTRSHRARLTWLHQISARAQLSASAGYDRIGSLLLPERNAVGPMVAIAGLQTLGPLGSIPIDRAQDLYRYEVQAAFTRGQHSLTLGTAWLRRQFNGVETDTHRGYFSFSNDFGRTGIENLRVGTPSQYIISVGDVHRGYRQTMGAIYAGDNWRVRPDLTLNFGLRWEMAGRPYEISRIEQVPYGRDANNFAPRLGFAWRMPSRWGVLRAALGNHFADILPVTYSQIRFSPPGSVKLAIPAPDLLDPLSALKTSGQQADARPNRYALDPELATPYAYQYNFSWEPDLASSWRVQLGYVGSRSHKLLVMWYLNRAHAVAGIPQTTATINQRRPIPDLAEIRWVLNGSRGYYDAARVTLIAPRFHGLSFDAAYWFSKAMDLGADYTNTAYDADSRLSRSQSEFETQRDRKALSLFDQPHAFLLRATYEVPSASNGWLRPVSRGWALSAVALLKKGTPFTVSTLDGPGFGNVDGNGGDRPNLRDLSVLGRTVGDPDLSSGLLPAAAFAPMLPTDEAGNLGVNVFRRGGIRNLNAAVTRTFRLGSEQRLVFRAESNNLLNTPQFAEPGSIFGTPEFGFITNTLNDGRSFRGGVTWSW